MDDSRFVRINNGKTHRQRIAPGESHFKMGSAGVGKGQRAEANIYSRDDLARVAGENLGLTGAVKFGRSGPLAAPQALAFDHVVDDREAQEADPN